MSESESAAAAAREVQELRRSLRDVLALTMLPTVWARFGSRQICDDLVDVVARMVDADGVRLVSLASGCPEILHLKRKDDGEAESALRAALGNTVAGEVESVIGPDGSVLRLFPSVMSFSAIDRFVVAARREDFPTEGERLLIRVAANQAATWLEWKRAEDAAMAETRLRRAIEESMLAGVAIVDGSGRQTYVNRAFAAMVGWPEAELTGRMPPFVYWADEGLADVEAALAEVIAGRLNPAGYELLFRRKNGQLFDALVLISRLEGAGPNHGFLASVYDITERKAAERKARFLAEAGEILSRSLDYEETLRAISALVVSRLADWCFIDLVEGDGVFRRVALGHPPGAANAEIARRLKRSFPASSVLHGVARTLACGQSSVVNEFSEETLMAVSGDHRELLRAIGIRWFVSVPMIDHGSVMGAITLIGSDKRTRFRPEEVVLAEELAGRVALAVDNARLYHSAHDANRAKDEFLANLSHELRTPLTAILGWVYLLQLGDLEPEQIELGLQTIRQSGEAQAKLVDDLLDVSRIITGKLHINPVPVVLSEIVSGAVAAIRPTAEAKRQQLHVEILSTEARVLGDASRLQQVFWNLLNNAVKFTPPGGAVHVSLTSDGDHEILNVEDTGDGIQPDFLPLVFERFRQGTQASGVRAGLGLGLAIARELVEMHGGSIRAASAGRGAGSTFSVTLPRYSDSRRSAGTRRDGRGAVQHRLRALRVLLVEDDQATLALLATVLSSFGATVATAPSAGEAQATLATFDPEILVTDIEMPGGDGVSLLQLLRAARGAAFPAIAISGYADAATRDRVSTSGFNGFVAKPIDPSALADEILLALKTVRDVHHQREEGG